jgi:hypothetical protein
MPRRFVVTALAAALAGAVVALSAYPFDDAFIHLRLARNLAFHGVPYFNLGEPVMSGSSPLWMLWLAAAFGVLGRASIGVAVVTECLVVMALFFASEGFLAHGQRRSWATLVAAFVVTAVALPSAGGLVETPLAVTLLIGGLWAFRSDRFQLAGVLLGLAGATRFEMVLPAIGALALAPGWTKRFRLFAGAGPVWLAQAIFLESFYGALAPHAMAAKAVVYQLRRSDLLDMGPQEFGKQAGAILVLILCVATGAGMVRLLRAQPGTIDRPQRALLLLGIFPLLLIAIYLLQVPLIFPWYWTLSLCPMALFTWSRLQAELPMPSWKEMTPTTAVAMATTLAFGCAGLISAGAAFSGRLERSPWVLENARTRTYLKIGTVLADRCPGVVVAAPEIGALGWTFGGKILDGDGLASPEVLPFHPLKVPAERPMGGLGSIPGRAVAALRPDVVVSMEVFSTDFARKATSLRELSDYALWWKEPVFATDLPGLPAVLWGSRWTLVFSRHRSPQGVGCSA